MAKIPFSPELRNKMLHLANGLEEAGMDSDSVALSSHMRDLRMAASSDEVDVTSWEDFLRFFERNRGKELLYRFVDMYGQNNPITHELDRLLKEYDSLDQQLHGFYMKLKGAKPKEEETAASPEESLATLEKDDGAKPAAE